MHTASQRFLIVQYVRYSDMVMDHLSNCIVWGSLDSVFYKYCTQIWTISRIVWGSLPFEATPPAPAPVPVARLRVGACRMWGAEDGVTVASDGPCVPPIEASSFSDEPRRIRPGRSREYERVVRRSYGIEWGAVGMRRSEDEVEQGGMR